MKTRQILLYSDQEIPENRTIDQRLIKMLAGSENRVAYVASSLEEATFYYQRKKNYYADIGINLAEYFDESILLAPEAREKLLSYPAIHLSGGNTFHFRNWVFQSGINNALVEYSNAGGILIGTSAGTILLTPDISTAQLCGDTPPTHEYDSAGLDLVDFCVWPHYKKEGLANAAKISSLEPKKKIYGVPDGAGIIVLGSKIEIIGDVQQLNAPGACP